MKSNYEKLQHEWIRLNKVKKGDKVKLIKIPKHGEFGSAISDKTDEGLKIGMVGVIDDDFTHAMELGIYINFDEVFHCIPFNCLELIKPENVVKPKTTKKVIEPKIGQIYTSDAVDGEWMFTYIHDSGYLGREITCMVCVKGSYLGRSWGPINPVNSKDFPKVTEADLKASIGSYYKRFKLKE